MHEVDKKCQKCRYNQTATCNRCDMYYDEFEPIEEPPITNADRIRSMNDEELAELWWERVDCGECPVHKDCKMTGQDCKKLALDWLRQEVEE